MGCGLKMTKRFYEVLVLSIGWVLWVGLGVLGLGYGWFGTFLGGWVRVVGNKRK